MNMGMVSVEETEEASLAASEEEDTNLKNAVTGVE
jgi:hypothetical protein